MLMLDNQINAIKDFCKALPQVKDRAGKWAYSYKEDKHHFSATY